MESNPKLTTTISDDDVETKERLLSSHKFNQLSPSSSRSTSSLLSLKSTTTRKSSKGIMHKIRSRFTKVDSVIQAER
jgi:hypothetical protein